MATHAGQLSTAGGRTGNSMSTGNVEKHFKNYSAFVSQARLATADNRSAAHSISKSPQRWDYAVGMAGALDLADRGWPEGTERVNRLVSTLVDSVGSKMITEEWSADTEGAALDIGLYCAGEPEHWITPTPRATDMPSGAVCVLTINGAASHTVTADVLEARGSALAALAMLLEKAGRPTEIRLIYSLGDRSDAHCSLSIILKQPGQPLDIDRVTFACAHPAAFRRIGFGVQETLGDAVRKQFGFESGGGYGAMAAAPASMLGDIHIPAAVGSDMQWQSADAAEKWLTKHLAAQGCIASQ